MSLEVIKVLSTVQVDPVGVVHLVKINNLGRLCVVLVYCVYYLQYQLFWGCFMRLTVHLLGRFLKYQNELFF